MNSVICWWFRFCWHWVSADQNLPAPVIATIMVMTAMNRDKYREASRKGKNSQGDDKGSENFLHGASKWFRYTQLTQQATGRPTRVCKRMCCAGSQRVVRIAQLSTLRQPLACMQANIRRTLSLVTSPPLPE